MAILEYQGLKYTDSKDAVVRDMLTVEQALQITINNLPFTVTMRTPGNDNQLVRGLLFSEDVYRLKEVGLDIQYRNKNEITTIANVNIDTKLLGNGFKNSRTLLSVSSCGICGKQELNETSTFKDRLKSEVILPVPLLYDMFDRMRLQQDDFLRSGGSHAAAAFTVEGELLSLMEDIGRHNAVDKVIGDLISNGKLADTCCILVSGRISYEIVAKAYSASIPILAAVSAPSTLAVEYAKQFGLTLLGFCRGKKATCYSNPSRIRNVDN
jgi:FdhD protein